MPTDFTPDEILAMKILLARAIRSADAKTAIEEKQKALAIEYAEVEKRRISALNAFGAFGFELADPHVWDRVKEAMGDEAYNQGFVLAGRGQAKKENDSETSSDTNGRQSEEGEASVSVSTLIEENAPTIRNIVIAQLASAGEAGAKAADIRKFIEQTYNQTVHEKTVGMTLYRLSKDGLARRDGHTWFSAKPEAETENPGVGAPGSKEGVFS